MQIEGKTNKIDNFYNVLKGLNISNIVDAFALVKKVWDIYRNSSIISGEKQIYETMKDVSNEWKMEVPFVDYDIFMSLYKMVDETITWEDVLDITDSKENFRIPKALIHELEKQYTEGTSSVLITEAEKFVPYLQNIIDTHKNCSYLLTTMNHTVCIVLGELFEEYDNVEIIQTDIYDYEFTIKRFDLILSVPVFGVRERAEDNGQFICREFELIAAENLSLHLNSSGRLAIVLPARITFASGKVKELRIFLQSMYKILEIDELPSGIFANSAIKTFLFILTTGRTEDVIIRRLEADIKYWGKQEAQELKIADETFVFAEELEEREDWNVDRIFAAQDEEWQRFENSLVKKEELGNVAEVFRGKAVNRKDKNGSIGVINISNLKEYDIDYSHLEYLEMENRKVSNYLLQEGDILIPARGTVIRIGIFKEQVYPCIASSNIIIIRPKKELLSSIYLKMFLDSPLGNKLLSSKQQGTVVINLSYKDLRSMEIPLPTIEEQEELAAEYEKELKIYLETVQGAEKRWNETVERLQQKL